MGDRRYVYSLLVGRPERMKPLGRSWHRWEDNSKMDLQEVGWGGTDCMNLVRDTDRRLPLVNVVMNMHVSPLVRDTDRRLPLVNVVMNMHVSPCGCWATKSYSRLSDITFPVKAPQQQDKLRVQATSLYEPFCLSSNVHISLAKSLCTFRILPRILPDTKNEATQLQLSNTTWISDSKNL